MKKCPYCAEEVQDEAIICRFCKSDLSGTLKFRYVCEFLDEKNNFREHTYEACDEKFIQDNLAKKGWKLVTITKKGGPKRVLDEVALKAIRVKKAKKENVIFVIILITIVLLVLVGMSQSEESNASKSKKIEDFCRGYHPDKLAVCMDCVKRQGPRDLGACVDAFSKNAYSEQEKQAYVEIADFVRKHN